MLDPDGLYELTDELPELDRPILIQTLTGYVDAGSAVRLAREHLVDSLGARRIAVFDLDQLLNYRSRRPLMDFVEDHWERYDEPSLAIHHLRDGHGTSFLLLCGPEPDLQWERFTAAITRLIARLGVRVTVGLNAIPMAVPHTRPAGVTAHATRPALIPGYEPWLRHIRVPASVGNLLEFRLGQRGRDAFGFAAHVPHYASQSEYPAASEVLLTSVARTTGLLLPTHGLRMAADAVRTEIDEQVSRSDEATALVRGLEHQYDAYQHGSQGVDLLAPTGPIPTAEELGAELERFLAEQARPGDQAG